MTHSRHARLRIAAAQTDHKTPFRWPRIPGLIV